MGRQDFRAGLAGPVGYGPCRLLAWLVPTTPAARTKPERADDGDDCPDWRFRRHRIKLAAFRNLSQFERERGSELELY